MLNPERDIRRRNKSKHGGATGRQRENCGKASLQDHESIGRHFCREASEADYALESAGPKQRNPSAGDAKTKQLFDSTGNSGGSRLTRSNAATWQLMQCSRFPVTVRCRADRANPAIAAE